MSRVVKRSAQAELAMKKYCELVRPNAPWCPSNIEFIRRIKEPTVARADFLVELSRRAGHLQRRTLKDQGLRDMLTDARGGWWFQRDWVEERCGRGCGPSSLRPV